MKVGIYPGSFDPVTFGHLDVLNRALKVFDQVHLVIAESKKKKALFSVGQRKRFLERATEGDSRVKVVHWDGLIADYAREFGEVSLIRGLRATGDFEYEYMMAAMNRELNQDLETVFFCPSKDLFFVSSSMIKEVASFKGDVSPYVPDFVAKELSELQ